MGSGSNRADSSLGFLYTKKARACFALIIVNAVLIIGIFVSVSKGRANPTPQNTCSTNGVPTGERSPSEDASESIRLQSVKMQIPVDIQNSLMKVHSYMESNMEIKGTARCHFAWKYDPKNKSMDLFICE